MGHKMNITEADIRDEINKVLQTEYFYSRSQLNEGGYAVNLAPGEFSDIFFEPWKQAWKGIFAELKKITSSALTLVRISFTLNQKKAQEIIARQKDRMKQFSKESDEAMNALPGKDFQAAMFIMNPGFHMAKALGVGGMAAVDAAKQIGIGDKSIATATGEEKEEDALIRRRDQDGPVTKVLRALEQIFFLAHAKPSGPLIVESVESDLESEIMSGPIGAEIEKQQKAFVTDVEEFIQLIDSIAAQNSFLSVIARIETANDPALGLRQMDDALSELTADDPDAAKEFAQLPAKIREEADTLMKSEKFRTELDKQTESEEGTSDYEKEALKTVLGAAFADNFTEYMRSIMQNNQLLDETFQILFGAPEIDEELVSVINTSVSGFADHIRTAEKILGRRLIS